MQQPWPWVKVRERSFSTFPQTHIFFVLNIKGLAQTVLTWEGKVFAAADADAAETNWKHKVTPDWGDLINQHWLRWWPYRQQAIIWTNDGLFYWHIYASLGLNGLSNYANPVYCVSTICHQVLCLRWGHPSLFHTATYLFIWYKIFRMGDTDLYGWNI